MEFEMLVDCLVFLSILCSYEIKKCIYVLLVTTDQFWGNVSLIYIQGLFTLI